VTSRPVSGERFFVAINLHTICLKERRIIEEKLWILCGEIAVWEREKEVRVEKEGEKEVEKEGEGKIYDKDDINQVNNDKDNDNDSNYVDYEDKIPTLKHIQNKAERKEKTERKEDNIFHINWPFHISNEIFITASNYLTDMNNSHILTQLISLYKIIVLARDRGCAVVDAELVYELGKSLFLCMYVCTYIYIYRYRYCIYVMHICIIYLYAYMCVCISIRLLQ
jgi:hypothetical protein